MRKQLQEMKIPLMSEYGTWYVQIWIDDHYSEFACCAYNNEWQAKEYARTHSSCGNSYRVVGVDDGVASIIAVYVDGLEQEQLIFVE